jgi:signal transduction histidine kinase/DNA-binding NarL/FixJ family response regulator
MLSQKIPMEVLLVEDNPGDARLLREMFNEKVTYNVKLTHVESMSAAEKIVAEHIIDIIVLDLGLPDAHGLETLRRAQAAGPHIPVVVLTGLDDKALAVHALQEGAQDYLVKGQIETLGLMRALRYAVERKTMEVNIDNDMIGLKRAEAGLRESDLMLRLALDVSEQGVWQWAAGQGADKLEWDARCKSLFGLAPDTPVNYAVWAGAIFAEDRVMAEESLTRAMDPADPLDEYVCEYRAVRPDGTVLWVAAIGRAVFEPDLTGHAGRRFVRILGTIRDVSQAKLIEYERKSHQRELEQRTRELERSNAALQEFAYAASHDLQAPLRAIAHLAQWIDEDIGATANPETVSNLKLLNGRVARLQMLIRGLLAYARVGRTNAEAEDVDVAAAVQDVVNMLEPRPGFVVVCEGEMSTIRTPRAPFETVLKNLISNALQHHDRAEGRITVAMRLIDGMAEIRVGDDGAGIDKRFHAEIFVIFKTLESRDVAESGGIGLAMVKRQVTANGGQIWVESAPPARGTTFVFTWQLATP